MANSLYRDVALASGFESLKAYRYRATTSHKLLVKKLASARENGTLTIIMGAGVSRPSGISDWQSLVQMATERVFANSAIPDMTSILFELKKPATVAVRFCETSLGLQPAFRAVLQGCLYSGYERTRRNETLDALSEVILGVDGGKPINSVITYNFDNLLELTLRDYIRRRRLRWEVQSIYRGETKRVARANVIRVFHPHGFIPYGRSFAAIDRLPLVFSERDYHEQFNDFDFWANSLQVDAFRTSTCLFVGLSFECPNMRRLLDRANGREVKKGRHAAVMRLRPDHHRNLEHYFMTEDLGSFGVRPIWVKEHEDVPGVVHTIKL